MFQPMIFCSKSVECNTVCVTHCNENPIYVFPGKEFARPQSQFPRSCVCERFIYSQDRSTYFPAAEWEDRSREFINRSNTHDCGNWDWGHAIPFLGIFVANFWNCVYAVQECKTVQMPSCGFWRGVSLKIMKRNVYSTLFSWLFTQS